MKKKLLIAGIVGVLIVLAMKAGRHRRSEWQDLTEEQARAKLDERLPHRIPEEKRAVVADKVVAKMRQRGVIREATDVVGDTDDDAGLIDVTMTASNEAEADASARARSSN